MTARRRDHDLSPQEYRLSRYSAVSPSVRNKSTGRTERVAFATRTASARIVSDNLWTALADGNLEHVPQHVIADLADIELLVLTSEDELEIVLSRQRSGIAESRNLYVVIQPTAACQLGCGYCGQEHAQRRISLADQDALLVRVGRQVDEGDFDSVEVSWFGGEPLLALHAMRRLSGELKRLCADRGLIYAAKVVTNGLRLNADVGVELVLQHNVRRVEVTLDGSSNYHDGRRHTKAGRGTYDAIFDNVVGFARAHSPSCQTVIRCNVDSTNCDGVAPLLYELAGTGIQDRVSFYTAPIRSWGNDAHLGSLPRDDYARREMEWLALMLELGFTPGILPSLKPIVCLAVDPNGTLIDAYGRLFNCTEVSHVPLYERPLHDGPRAVPLPSPTRRWRSSDHGVAPPPPNSYTIGHVQTQEIPGARLTLGDFNEIIQSHEVPCASCRMLPVCGGGCPKLWREGLVPCPSTKDNISERLLLLHPNYTQNYV